jgi:hypothetical protein
MIRFTMVLAVLLVVALSGCRQAVDGTPLATNQPNNAVSQPTALPTYKLTLSTEPATLSVGNSVLVFDLTAPDGSPVPTDQVRLLSAQGDMTHAGMVPVIEDGRAASFATDQVGRYEMAFNFNMGGDWMITATATLTDGTVITGRLNTSVR